MFFFHLNGVRDKTEEVFGSVETSTNTFNEASLIYLSFVIISVWFSEVSQHKALTWSLWCAPIFWVADDGEKFKVWEVGKGRRGQSLSDPDHFRKTPVASWTIYYHLSSFNLPTLPLRFSAGGGQSRQTAAGRKWRRRVGTSFIYGALSLTRRSARRRRWSGSKRGMMGWQEVKTTTQI